MIHQVPDPSRWPGKAQAAAGDSGLAQIRTEDLLSALVADDNMAVRALGALEITPRQIRSELASREHAHAGPAARRPARGATAAAEPGLGPQAAAALELAAAESSGPGNTYVGCEHLALGLISEPGGVAGSVLRSLGADLRVTRRTVAAALAGWGAGAAAHEHRRGPVPPSAAVRSLQIRVFCAPSSRMSADRRMVGHA